MAKNDYTGTWRITGMELWDQEYVNMEVPGFINIASRGWGEFQFGLVRGGIDWNLEVVNGMERIEFSWNGEDESTPASGRGWAVLDGIQLKGRFYFYMGDNSGFTARRKG
ncbi:MAG: hypothetical protein JEZ02_21490 [Desulfatibacillum sp.]|nr:hypothetical protein [Desulfatibacillum sp.]